MKKMLVLLLSLLLLSGCRTINNQDVGTVVGGVAGGIIGNQIGGGSGRVIATIGGAAIGALVGGRIGASMDQRDYAEVHEVLEDYPDGRERRWHNPNTDRDYVVTPMNTYESGDRPCRKYRTTVIIGGKQKNAYGTACRDHRGRWRIQS